MGEKRGPITIQNFRSRLRSNTVIPNKEIEPPKTVVAQILTRSTKKTHRTSSFSHEIYTQKQNKKKFEAWFGIAEHQWRFSEPQILCLGLPLSLNSPLFTSPLIPRFKFSLSLEIHSISSFQYMLSLTLFFRVSRTGDLVCGVSAKKMSLTRLPRCCISHNSSIISVYGVIFTLVVLGFLNN